MAKKNNQKTVKPVEEASEEVESEEPKEAKALEEASEEVESEEPKEAKALEESTIESLPQFKNNGEAIKINLGNRNEPNWITVKAGEVVEIPRKIALANKLEEVK